MKYGWHGFNALAALLYESNRQESYDDYIGVVQRGILGIMAARVGVELSLPQYIDYRYPDKAQKQETAEEIKARILEKLAS